MIGFTVLPRHGPFHKVQVNNLTGTVIVQNLRTAIALMLHQAAEVPTCRFGRSSLHPLYIQVGTNWRKTFPSWDLQQETVSAGRKGRSKLDDQIVSVRIGDKVSPWKMPLSTAND